MGAHKYTLRPIRVLVIVGGGSFPLALASLLGRLTFLVWIMIIWVHLVLMHLSAFFLKGVLAICG